MHQKQHTHELDVYLHPCRPDVDSKQRDAGIFMENTISSETL